MSYTKDEQGNIVKKPIIEHLKDAFSKKEKVSMPPPIRPTQQHPQPLPTTEDYLKAIISNQEMIYSAIDVLRKKLNALEQEEEEPEELSEEEIEAALAAYKETKKASKKTPGRPKKKK